MSLPLRRTTALLAATTVVLGLAACASPTPGAEGGAKPLDEVTLILDWTPNTNHTGLHVAEALGYYRDAGIDLTIQGYSESGVESVLDAGGADFGISGATSLTFADAAGADLVSVFNIAQVPSTRLAVNADTSDITRPKQLEGKVYAGFGQPFENAVVRATIEGDGGDGEFESVSLSTAAYDALYDGKADFAAPLTTWEGIEADLKGTPLRYFDPADYGVPGSPSEVGISARRDFVEKNRDLVTRFVQATERGYEYAADNPEKAGTILIEQNPQAALDPELVQRSQKVLSAEYWKDADGRVGRGDAAKWTTFVTFLTAQGLLAGPDGTVLTQAPDAASLFTNEFLAG